MTLITSFAFGMIAGSSVLRFVQNHIQPINPYVPEAHSKKKNTPTMGGLLIIVAIFFTALCNTEVWHYPLLSLTLSCTGAFAILGAVDDVLKVRKKNHFGVSGKTKMLCQYVISSIFLFFHHKLAPDTHIYWPWGGSTDIGWLYHPFAATVIVGSSNAVNLTDGLDGLAAMPAIMVCVGLIAVGFLLPGNHFEAMWLSSVLAGGTLAFLWFNAHPAAIFMGDVGSLMIGGLLGMISIILHQELLFGIMSMLFVVEALSSIIQVASFKIRRKRVFLMAPIHHHFEKMGIAETTIVIKMWIFSFIFVVLGILLCAHYAPAY